MKNITFEFIKYTLIEDKIQSKYFKILKNILKIF